MPAVGGPNVQVEGLNRMVRTLRRAGADLGDLKDAHRRAAEVVLPAAAAIAPHRSGRLAASLRAGATAGAGTVKAGGKAKAPYANPIHWGWFSRPDPDKGWRGGPIRPNSFMSRAAQRTEPTWVPIFEAEMLTAIRKVKGK